MYTCIVMTHSSDFLFTMILYLVADGDICFVCLFVKDKRPWTEIRIFMKLGYLCMIYTNNNFFSIFHWTSLLPAYKFLNILFKYNDVGVLLIVSVPP